MLGRDATQALIASLVGRPLFVTQTNHRPRAIPQDEVDPTEPMPAGRDLQLVAGFSGRLNLRENHVGQRFQTLSATKQCQIQADKLPEQRKGPFLLNPATTLAFRHVGHIRNRPPAIPPIYARKPMPTATLSKIPVPWKTRNQLWMFTKGRGARSCLRS